MYTTEQFENAIDALDADVQKQEVRLLPRGVVREFVGYIGGIRHIWTASGECLKKGRERVPELDLKFK